MARLHETEIGRLYTGTRNTMGTDWQSDKEHALAIKRAYDEFATSVIRAHSQLAITLEQARKILEKSTQEAHLQLRAILAQGKQAARRKA